MGPTYRVDRPVKGHRGSSPINGMTGIHVGIVKANDDPQRMGRLMVWIPELGGNPDDEGNWLNVSYASPFAGATSAASLRQGGEDMASSSQSYGWWAVPPDLDNQVLCCFVNGDMAKGFWFACLYQQNMNHMVPGIPSNIPTDPTMQPPHGIDGSLPPVVEYNRWSDVNPSDPPRPVFEPLHEGLLAQGLYRDLERGPSSSGARREAPSQVFGLLSPAGNSITVDDDPENSFIRFRTRNGVQVLLHDTTGYVYVISGNGNSWAEISNDGVDIYSKQSVSIRAEENLNFHADKDIMLYAGGNIHARAGSTITTTSGTNTEMKVGADFNLGVADTISTKAGTNILMSAAGNIASDAGADHTEAAGGNHVRTAGNIHDNSSVSAPASGAAAPTTPDSGTRADGGTASGEVQSIVDRLPTHEPWPLHPRNEVAALDHITELTGTDISNNTTPGSGTDSAYAQRSFMTGSGRTSILDQNYEDSSPKVSINGYKVSQTVLAAIKEASSRTGVDFGFLMAMCAQESAFNPNARPGINPKTGQRYSSAVGLYQFLNSTWESMVKIYGGKYKVGINDRTIPSASAIMGAQFAKDNSVYLKGKGHTVGRTEMYMAHFLGQGGANSFLSAMKRDPAGRADAVLPAAAKANPSVFYRNGAPKSLGDVYKFYKNKIEPMAVAFAKQYGDSTNA